MTTTTALSLTVGLDSLIRLSIFMLMAGTALGIWICRKYYMPKVERADDERLETVVAADAYNTDDGQSNEVDCNNDDQAVKNWKEDGPTMVLRGSLDLLASKWGLERGNSNSSSLIHETNNGHDKIHKDDGGDDDAVVRYLSPEQMTNLLFAKPTADNVTETLCLDEVVKMLPTTTTSSLPSSPESESEGGPELLEVLLQALQHSPKSSSAAAVAAAATDITSLISSSEEGSESSDHDDTVVVTTTAALGNSIIAAPSTSSFTSTTTTTNSSLLPSSQQQQQHHCHCLNLLKEGHHHHHQSYWRYCYRHFNTRRNHRVLLL